MAGPRDAASPGWDALAPASGTDALAVPAGDALAAAYAEPSADALAVGYRADALAAGSAATGDALASPPLGDTFGDSLAAYGDATATGQAGARRAPARRPRPGPVPPRTADERAAGSSRRAEAGRPDTSRRPGGGGSTPGPRRAARPGAGGSPAGPTARPATGGGGSRLGGSRLGGSRVGGSGAGGSGAGGSGAGRTGSFAGSTGGSPYSRGGSSGPAAQSGRAANEQGPGWSPPWWANRTSRPTGTVPWAGGSGRSGWDDFLAGMGGTTGGSGKQPSGAEVARALFEAFRRSLRGR